MSLRLVVVQGQGIGAQLRLSQQPVVEVGRSPTADLTLADPQVAEFHLKLYREGATYTCFDVTGQGFVHNGKRALKATLQVGDVIQVGTHALRLITDRPEQMPDAAAAPPAAGFGPPSADGPVLVAVKGNDVGKTFDLGDKAVVILGRGVSTDVTLWDIRASRAHARIDRRGSAFRLSDLNSSNGTFVQGQRITTHDLRDGDVIKIGGTLLRFHPTGAPQAQAV